MRMAPWLLLVATAAAPAGEGGEGIEWSKDLEDATRAAARDNRPVLLYFTFDT